jgi:hypothetical protein
MTHKLYAGIGARATPPDVLQRMQGIGLMLAMSGWKLRSGGAHGADLAFEVGSSSAGVKPEIFVALNASRNPAWFNHASKYHPKWDSLSRGAQQLHARNSAIVLGADLQTPVRFIVCWTPGGAVTGGTGQALRIAADYSIPVFNLATDGAELDMWAKTAQL